MIKFRDEFKQKANDFPITSGIDESSTGQQILNKIVPKISSIRKITDWHKLLPTLYYEDDDRAASKSAQMFCKKRIIFLKEQTLEDFKEVLRSNLRGDIADHPQLTLHYAEGLFF